MTLLFEDMAQGIDSTPSDLVSAGARGVSLLEFLGVEEASDPFLTGLDAEADTENEFDLKSRERAQQLAVMLDAARAEARAETRAELEQEVVQQLDHERRRIDQLCQEFARDRQRYFATAETQVVKLALAVATRVLDREVAADPMHLGSIVKRALGKIQDGSATALRVRPQEVESWSALLIEANEQAINVVADPRLHPGQCVLETVVGRVELGVEAQLEEIDRTFGELMPVCGE